MVGGSRTLVFAALSVATFMMGCSSGGKGASVAPLPADQVLTVFSSDPGLGVPIKASPADVDGKTGGLTGLTLKYAAGTAVTLTAPTNSGTTLFSSWTGCEGSTSNICTVTLNANTMVTAGYVAAPKGVAQVTVTPAVVSVSIGSGQQFLAAASGTGTFDPSVTWSVAAGTGATADAGTITSSGQYQTPYPAPATVTVTATSKADPTVSGSAVVTLAAPAPATGPALSVDAEAVTHPINSLIYAMNNYQLDPSIATKFHLPADRWGGDATSRYNYQLDVTNNDNDYFFETLPNSNTKYPDVSDFNTQVTQDEASKTMTIATMPVIGWTTKRQAGCGFSIKKYGTQQKVDPYDTDCGNGVKADGTNITGNDPTDTSAAIDQSFDTGWVKYLVNKFGTAANGGIGEYELDNEPEFWSSTHRDVHPKATTYDEITNNALTYAGAIKASDPTAAVGGPVIAFFPNYFYSWADLVSGWATAPCYCTNGNPTDRLAHGDVAFLDYYLQHFKSYEDMHGVRLLDYLDLHGYYAADNAAFALAGDTTLQAARLESTRAMWDPTFANSGYTDPDNRTSSAKLAAIQLIPRMRNWIATDYPGTKLAITEYNWGGQEHINGALAQADLLGIFGREGLDEGVLWGPPDPVKQLPGLEAYLIYKNYDGAGAEFGDISVTSKSGNQSLLSVYSATRTSDHALTVMVINKSFGDLTTTLSLANFTTTAKSEIFLYSAANTGAIVAQPSQALTAPATAGGPSMLTMTFPAASITLLVVPKS